MKGKYLITTDAWFYAPDGRKYRSAWGEVEILEDKVLGVATNRNSSNWFAKVGSENNHIVIAGCQIHYAIKCESKPNTEDVGEVCYGNGKSKPVMRECEIYIAE